VKTSVGKTISVFKTLLHLDMFSLSKNVGDFFRSRIRKDRTARLKKKKEIIRRVKTSHEEVSRGSRAVTSRKCKKRGARACVRAELLFCKHLFFFDVVIAAVVVGESFSAKVGDYLRVSHP